ncbi:hypothetical protein ASA1KI_42610 [Opitutales bacterium ASA1]|uniref:addiction module protein n=1 Tax=Congregicoccus parvus TaxID=3081749 RepID=UPI002B2CC471|nr:hypothetical protein ASA1KI_42610 [Opitutales bacterium ASA1]
MSSVELAQMSRLDKLRLMEAIWTDLSREEGELESPVWHRETLQATADRLAAGQEEIVDWSQAKKQLRARFE